MKITIDKDGMLLNEDGNPIENIRFLKKNETIIVIDKRGSLDDDKPMFCSTCKYLDILYNKIPCNRCSNIGHGGNSRWELKKI